MSQKHRSTWRKSAFADHAWSRIACAYLGLCWALGGASAAGAIANAFLQAVGLIIIVVALWRPRLPAPREAITLGLMVAAFVFYNLLTLVPLPPGLLSGIFLRGEVIDDYKLLGVRPPWLAISLAPLATISSLLTLIPPIAIFMMVLRVDLESRKIVPATILVLAVISAVLGAFQLAMGSDSPLRPYEITNPTRAVGLFANANHEITLLLCGVACAGYLAQRAVAQRRHNARANGAAIAVVACVVFLVLGIAMGESGAGYGLFFPAALGAFMIFKPDAVSRWSWRTQVVAVVIPVAIAIAALSQAFYHRDISPRFEDKVASRQEMATTSVEVVKATLPVGTGLGTFAEVYRWFEDPEIVTSNFVNHAHDDYLEFLIEMGVAGVLFIIAFVVWWARQLRVVWRGEFNGSGLAQTGSLIIGLVLLHSVVDYPLRTSAIAAIFAAACALLVGPCGVRPGHNPARKPPKNAFNPEAST